MRVIEAFRRILVGFANGFLALSDYAELFYKSTDYWAPEHERSMAWNDPDLGIAWSLAGEPILAAKDRSGRRLAEVDVFD